MGQNLCLNFLFLDMECANEVKRPKAVFGLFFLKFERSRESRVSVSAGQRFVDILITTVEDIWAKENDYTLHGHKESRPP